MFILKIQLSFHQFKIIPNPSSKSSSINTENTKSKAIFVLMNQIGAGTKINYHNNISDYIIIEETKSKAKSVLINQIGAGTKLMI